MGIALNSDDGMYGVGMALTYEEVAKEANLTVHQAERFCRYMRFRWDKEEALQCTTGYALEWAERFKSGYEYEASDAFGKSVLRFMDQHEALSDLIDRAANERKENIYSENASRTDPGGS